MTLTRDPADLTPEERLAEVAFLLAAAYLRVLVSRQKELEDSTDREPSCHQVANSPGTTGKEGP